MTVDEALRLVRSLSDEDLHDAYLGADFTRRGYGHDRKVAARWATIAAQFSAEIKRRRECSPRPAIATSAEARP